VRPLTLAVLDKLVPCKSKVFNSALSQAREALTALENVERCVVCAHPSGFEPGLGALLLCDGCDSEWHLTCCLPPMDSVPEGSWFCAACVRERREGKVAVAEEEEAAVLQLEVNQQSARAETAGLHKMSRSNTIPIGDLLSLPENGKRRRKSAMAARETTAMNGDTASAAARGVSARRRKSAAAPVPAAGPPPSVAPSSSSSTGGAAAVSSKKRRKRAPVAEETKQFPAKCFICSNDCVNLEASLGSSIGTLKCSCSDCDLVYHSWCLNESSLIAGGGDSGAESWKCPRHFCSSCGCSDSSCSGAVAEPFWLCRSCPLSYCSAHVPAGCERQHALHSLRQISEEVTIMNFVSVCWNCKSPMPRIELAKLLEHSLARASSNYLAVPFMDGNGLMAMAVGDQRPKQSTLLTLMSIRDRVRNLHYESSSAFLHDVKAIESSMGALSQRVEAEGDRQILLQAVATVVETCVQALEGRSVEVRAADAKLAKGATKVGPRMKGKGKGKACDQVRAGSPKWRSECGRGRSAAPSVTPRSIREWVEYLKQPPLLGKRTGEVIAPRDIVIAGREGNARAKGGRQGGPRFRRAGAVSSNSTPATDSARGRAAMEVMVMPDPADSLALDEVVCPDGDMPDWGELRDAVGALRTMHGGGGSNSATAGTSDAQLIATGRMLEMLERQGQLLRAAVRQNAQARCMWLDLQSTFSRASPSATAAVPTVCVTLGAGDQLEELKLENEQLRKRLALVEQEGVIGTSLN
jgi:hypothetical protein